MWPGTRPYRARQEHRIQRGYVPLALLGRPSEDGGRPRRRLTRGSGPLRVSDDDACNQPYNREGGWVHPEPAHEEQLLTLRSGAVQFAGIGPVPPKYSNPSVIIEDDRILSASLL